MHIERACKEFLKGYFSTNSRREKTRAAYVSDMGQFREFAGNKLSIHSLKSTDIERWADQLKNKGYAPASIRRKIVVLKVFCTYWVRYGLLSESPFWRVKINFGRIIQLPRTLTEQEVHGLLLTAQQQHSKTLNRANKKRTGDHLLNRASSRNFLDLRNAAILELLFATGLRVGEISAINLEDLMSDQASFKVHGKGGRERLAFVVDSVSLKTQQEYLVARQNIKADSSALFLNASSKRLSPQGIANIIHQLSKSSGIERHITPHMFRHTVATLLLRNGVDIRVVQEFLGHASITTTQRYTHIAKEHMIRELQNRHPSLSLQR